MVYGQSFLVKNNAISSQNSNCFVEKWRGQPVIDTIIENKSADFLLVIN